MRERVWQMPGSERLDKALHQLFVDLSRTEARRLIAAGAVFVDGRRTRVASRPVGPGAVLRVAPATPAPPHRPPLAVLYAGRDCIAIDKPAGMPSAPTRSAAAGTALEELQLQLRAAGEPAALWVVHRLDTGTSGVLLFARNKAAAARLSAAFREHRVHKLYVARIAGAPEEPAGRIELPLATRRGRAVVAEDGRPALTEWRVLRRDGASTLLELQPHSGRLHQIRAHLQAIGHPILGDRAYGGRAAPRLMLHAAALELPGDDGAPPLLIRAPVPARLDESP